MLKEYTEDTPYAVIANDIFFELMKQGSFDSADFFKMGRTFKLPPDVMTNLWSDLKYEFQKVGYIQRVSSGSDKWKATEDDPE